MNLPSKLNTGLWYLDIYDLVCMRMYYANACWNAYELQCVYLSIMMIVYKSINHDDSMYVYQPRQLNGRAFAFSESVSSTLARG